MKGFNKTTALLVASLGLGACATTSYDEGVKRQRNTLLEPVKPADNVNIIHYKKVEELIELARRQCRLWQESYGSVSYDPMKKGCEELTSLAIEEAKKISNQPNTESSPDDIAVADNDVIVAASSED